MGASGLRQTSRPSLRVALQREGRTHVRLEVYGYGGSRSAWATLEEAEAALIDTHMTSVWVQWGPGGVTFKLWMFFR